METVLLTLTASTYQGFYDPSRYGEIPEFLVFFNSSDHLVLNLRMYRLIHAKLFVVLDPCSSRAGFVLPLRNVASPFQLQAIGI
jgi:hypothetical protein